MFVDTHAHLTDKAFDGKVDQVIKRSKEMGVEKIVTSSVDLRSSIESTRLAAQFDEVYSSIGIYPEYIYDWDKTLCNQLASLATQNKVVAIGEIGLQFTDGMPDRESQQMVLKEQLHLAYELKLPVILHCREAYGAMLELLKEEKAAIKYGAAMHCYSGSKEIAKELLKLGIYISVGGVSTFKNALSLKETLKSVPNEMILFETDCPYLAPHPYRGQINEPSFIPTIAENLAHLKGMEVEELALIVRENTRRLLKI